jgi:hypothetical protein
MFYKARHRKSSNKFVSTLLASLLALAGISTVSQSASAAPQSVTVTAVSPNIAKVTWQAPSAGTVSKYSVDYKLSSDSSWTVADGNVASNVLRRNINGLSAASTYDVRVVATFSDNSTASSTSTSYTTGTACALPGSHSSLVGSGQAQELFLGGNFIELGISASGNFGTNASKPAGFYGTSARNNIGMSVDYDGFNCGSAYSMDFFLPGGPEERFTVGIQQGGTTSIGSLSALNANTLTNDLKTWTKVLTNNSTSTTLSGRVVTTFKDTSGADSMELTQDIAFGVNDKFFTNTITIKNLSTNSWTSTRYMRSFDPDNTKDRAGGDYTTENEVLATQAADSKAVVRARAKTGDQTDVVQTYDTRAPILFYSTDPTARASAWGFANSNPYASSAWDSPSPAKNSAITEDGAINIVFEQGALAAGASTQLSYVTSLDERDFTLIAQELEQAQAAASNAGAPSITGVSGGNASLSVTFNPPANDGGSPITGYEYSLDGSSTWVSVVLPDPAVNAFTISSLSNATTYAVRLRAVNSIGPSSASSPSNGTTFAVPGAPTATKAKLTGADSDIYVEWTAPASNGGSPISDYIIEYSDDAGANWQVATDSVSTATNATFTSLSRTTTYIFKVKAVNVVGSSLYGNVTSKVIRGVKPTSLNLVAPTLSFTPNNSSTTTAAQTAMLNAKIVEAPSGIPGIEITKDLSAASGSGLKILESTTIESGSKATAEIAVSSSLATNKVAAGFLRIGSGSWFYLGNKPLVLDATTGNYIASTDSMAFAQPTTPGSEFVMVVAIVDSTFGEANVASLTRLSTVRLASISTSYTYNYSLQFAESTNIRTAAVSNSNISSIGDAQIQLQVTVTGSALTTTAPSSSGGSSYNPPVAAPPVVEAPVIIKQKTVRYDRFVPNRSALTRTATSGISKTIKSFKKPKTVVCTGYALGSSSSVFSKKVATLRAQNACNLAKRLAPAVKTQVKINVSLKGGTTQRGVSMRVTGE